MPSLINALREQRTSLAKEVRNLLDNNPGAKWKENASNQTSYDVAVAKINEIDDEIKRLQAAADFDADQRFSDAVDQVEKDKKGKGARNPMDLMTIFDTYLRQGESAITAEQWQVVRNTMSTTTGSEGGYTVPSLIAAKLYDAMKAFGAMRAVGEVIRTSDGKPLSFPTSDGTAEVGELIAQNTTATAADAVFGTVSLNVFKYSSKIVAVPFELLQDSIIDVEGFVTRRLAQRLGRIGNQHFTTGTGGGAQPDGVVTRASSGKVGTTGQTLLIIYDDVVDLVHSVDPAYRNANSAFMTNDSLLKVLRKIKDTAGRPIWTPSYDGGMAIGLSKPGSNETGGYAGQDRPVMFDTLLGYPVWVNNDIAVPAANAKTMTFGDHSYYKIRDAMEVTMFRFIDSAYAKLGQVGFLAWARMGGNLLDTAAVKYYQHSAT
jgi:HK97 family phage major capsid protein